MQVSIVQVDVDHSGSHDEGDKAIFKHRKTGELRAYINKLRDDDEINEKEYKEINKKERATMLDYCNKNWSKENYNETMGIDEFPAGYAQES